MTITQQNDFVQSSLETIQTAISGIQGNSQESIRDLNESIINLFLKLTNKATFQEIGLVKEKLPLFFQLLGSGYFDQEQLRRICSVIELSLSNEKYDSIFDAFKDYLVQGLTQTEEPLIQKLALRIGIQRSTADPSSLSLMLSSNLFQILLHGLSSEDLSFSLLSQAELLKIAKFEVGIDHIFNSSSISILQDIMHISEVVKFRVLEFLIQVCLVSEYGSAKCVSSGFLNELVTVFESDDVAEVLNVIEIFSNLVQKDIGYSLIEEIGILKKMILVLSIEDEDVEVALKQCAILRFFSTLADKREDDFIKIENTYKLTNQLKKFLDYSATQRDVAVIVLGNIGNSPRGLKLLESSGALNKFIEVFNESSNNLRILCMHSLSLLLGCSSETILSEKIYQQIRVPGSNTLSFFIKESKNAFEEVKVAVYSIIKSITVHKWGLEIMKGSHEFGPFILNRHLESTKFGLEWKYAILQSIRTNPFFRSIFDEVFVAGVEKYLKDGVFYSEHVPIVEVEGGL